MFKDPIVQEIRETRDRIAAKYEYNIHRLFSHWRKCEKKHKSRIVKPIRNSKQSDGDAAAMLQKQNQ
jgi:hypothetical protein